MYMTMFWGTYLGFILGILGILGITLKPLLADS